MHWTSEGGTDELDRRVEQASGEGRSDHRTGTPSGEVAIPELEGFLPLATADHRDDERHDRLARGDRGPVPRRHRADESPPVRAVRDAHEEADDRERDQG